jgi:hypothetical protein
MDSADPIKKETPDASPTRSGGAGSGDNTDNPPSGTAAGKPDFVARLTRAVSEERLDAYRQDGVDAPTAWGRYLWNLALCEALYPSLQLVEIALRNALHHTLHAHTGQAAWYDCPVLLLGPKETANLTAAREELRRAEKAETPGGMVAELSFGFWTGLFEVRYEHPRHGLSLLWPGLLRRVMPRLPKQIDGRHGNQRHAIYGRLTRIRKLRNRVFHHERILHWTDLDRQHASIVETIAWISPELQSLAPIADRFPHVYATGAAPYIANARQTFASHA